MFETGNNFIRNSRMKNFLWIFLFLPCLAIGQRSNEIQIRAGYGIALYKTDFNWSYNLGNVQLKYDTTDGAACVQIPIELRYELTDRFNAGLDMKFGRYLYASDDNNSGKSNFFRFIGIGLEGTIYSQEDSRVYLGLGLNTGKLETTETKNDFFNGLYTEKILWSGGGLRLNLGACHFIKNGPIGLNLNAGYDQHNFKLKDVTHNGNSQDITGLTGGLKVSGFEINVGLIFRVRT
jgi:Outer membrane protein beta-barrel domain